MIYLLRHGLDDERFIGGHSDVDLVDEGFHQICKSSEFILDNLNISRIYSSDIERCVSTSDIVTSYINKEVSYSSLLRELDKGDFTGRLVSSLTEEEKEFINNMTIDTRYPNGESMRDMYNRVKSLLDNGYFLDKESSLVVTHRGVINMMYFIFNREELSLNKTMFGVTHGSIHEVDLKNKKIKKIY